MRQTAWETKLKIFFQDTYSIFLVEYIVPFCFPKLEDEEVLLSKIIKFLPLFRTNLPVLTKKKAAETITDLPCQTHLATILF